MIDTALPVETPFVPAPWTLAGAGWIVPQLQRVADVAAYVPDGCQIVAWRGWTLGGYVCVDYTASPVGPYRELIFVPALVRRGWQPGFHVSHIYVDSTASVAGGRGNWWLPKELLQFDVQRRGHITLFKAYSGTQPIATGVFTASSVNLPFNNRWWSLALLQARNGQLRRSRFWARGRVGVANGVVDVLDAAQLPQPKHVVRLPLVSVSRFRLVFEAGTATG